MHHVLAHSVALIAANESTGLGSLSEEPFEHNNKNICNYREHLSCKTTQHANLSDILTKLWVKSDPIIRSARKKGSFCSNEHIRVLKSNYEKVFAFCLRKTSFVEVETPTAFGEQI